MTHASANPNPDTRRTPLRAAMCVLASGSRGNATVVRIESGGATRLTLVDAGLSPLRTRRLLAALGHTIDNLYDVVLTHLDSDHFHMGWIAGLPRHARVHVHTAHADRAMRCGLGSRRLGVFDAPFELHERVRVEPALLSHDELGVAAFRVRFGEAGAPTRDLGFATDVGRVSDELVDHLRGVEVLAIESNYCARLQRASDRPEYLKRRIMGGAGHMSNTECAEAVRRIGPRERVVLLHLSQQCNVPLLAASHHDGAPYELTVTSQNEPTPWIPLAGEPAPAERTHCDTPARGVRGRQVGMFH